MFKECKHFGTCRMEFLDKTINSYLDVWLGPRDPRVKGWLLLENYTPTFIFSVLYLLIVWLGPKYMRNKQPFSCRGILVVYNLGLTLLSLYMFYELVTGVWEGGYNFFCQDTHSGGEADMKIIRVLWWYYFSKLIEFMDTFFFILRKNNHQITVLHVYHHATMLNIWWFVMNWVPCGHYSVCPDNLPDQLWCCLAMCISSGLAVFPDFLYDFFDYPLHKFLYSDLQQEGILEEERVSERLYGHCERVHKQLFFP
ncbi:elongation of very long chain fatty acids protein 5 isoform X2 [Falco rusticolus]|uniref:elongation of very long chain fatty acids protein 5 isoform X2 n=1 Tax=Falco rusticolus TaxID=120794 RepID=UPI000FFCC427|nr:elongation of very long chain fatty acids protein 5 isoform X2 [Falco rusticolus]